MSPAPYYQDEYVTLYHGDCREVLPTLNVAGSLVTDPPYGLGDRWTGGTWGAAPMYADARRWDVRIADADLRAMVDRFSPAIVWGGNYYELPATRCWLSWVKSSSMPTMADFELAWTNLDRPSKLLREDRNPDGPREHPTQKPLNVMLWCLSFLPVASVIVDPFAGSGTTLRAAKDFGRRSIGVEISEAYCEVVAKRLSQNVLDFGGVA